MYFSGWKLAVPVLSMVTFMVFMLSSMSFGSQTALRTCDGAITMAFNDSGLVSIAFVFCYVVVWLLWEAATRKSGGLPVLKGTHANTVR